jgi:RNA polymerase sigma factor (sigma-70 family)
MATELVPGVVAHLRRVALRSADSPASDAELLTAFLSNRDEEAFALLVHRHGPMVLGVCRRVLGNLADAEDACQATFLVFVRRAGSIRPPAAVGCWLHGVARNVARKARVMAARRRRHESEAGTRPRPENPDPDLRAVLDRELARLPADFRSAVLLCDLEGATRAEAARRLGWAEGTVASRLARGRQLLARRLIRAGLAATGGVAVGGFSPELAAETVRNGLAWASGPSGVGSPNVLALTHGALRTMTLKKLTIVSLAVIAVGIAGLTLRHAIPAAPAQAPPAKSPPVRVDPTVPVKADDKEPLITLRSVPPVVVKTVPTSGAGDVDPGLTEVKVTFSKDMTDESWSWSYLSEDTQLPSDGDKPIHYEKDKRTCVMKVKLEPGKIYAVWLNSEKYHNFKDADGQSAVPYLLVFKTKKKAD